MIAMLPYLYLLAWKTLYCIDTGFFMWLCFANRILTNMLQVTVWKRLPTEVSLLAVFKTPRLPCEWIQVSSGKAMWWRCRCPANKLPYTSYVSKTILNHFAASGPTIWPKINSQHNPVKKNVLPDPQNDEMYETIIVLHFGMFSYIAKARWHIILTFILYCLFYLLFQLLLLHNELP